MLILQNKGVTTRIFVKGWGLNFALVSKEIGVLRILMVNPRIVRVLTECWSRGREWIKQNPQAGLSFASSFVVMPLCKGAFWRSLEMAAKITLPFSIENIYGRYFTICTIALLMKPPVTQRRPLRPDLRHWTWAWGVSENSNPVVTICFCFFHVARSIAKFVWYCLIIWLIWLTIANKSTSNQNI